MDIKHLLDGTALAAVVASLAGWLPPVAAALGILWYCILIYDRFRYGPKRGGDDE